MAHTFKVGDIVRGISDRYGITNKCMTRGRVSEVRGDRIDVQVLEQSENMYLGRHFYGLDPNCFKHVEPVAPAAPISRTIYSPPATVVFWSDGSKTVAKCAPHERFDREKGLAIACAKKLLGEGYADAFKEFREPKNRVLTLAEVRALPLGTKVWVEHPIDAIFEDGAHQVEKREHIGLVLEDCSGYFWNPAYVRDFGCRYRVWLLPRKPTADELRANPWKREGCE
jgi:hypothetical protein